MTTSNFSRRAALILLLLCIVPYGSPALSFTGRLEKLEWDVLPPYCKARIGGNKDVRSSGFDASMSQAEVKQWQQRIGPLYVHLHHYCAGVVFLERAKRATTPKDKEVQFRKALGQINYTFSRAEANHPIYTKMAADMLRAYRALGLRKDAVDLIKTLIAKKPNDWLSYIVAAEYYEHDESPDQAIAALTQGERAAKDKSRIRYALAKLYLQKGQYEEARNYTRLAQADGMSTRWLAAKLEEAGYPVGE